MRYERDGFSVDSAKKKGRPLPQWYLNRPDAVPFEEFYHQAYFDLCTTRSTGEIPGPIPWDKIIMYSDRCELENDNEVFFCQLMRSMDVVYLSHVMEERRVQRDLAKKGGKGT